MARQLAAEGYLAASLFYRNRDAQLLSGVFAPREPSERDVVALLRLAQWLRAESGVPTLDVAFLGASMGTFPATWAASTRPELSELQEGLAIKTVITVGMLGNLWSNLGREAPSLVSSEPAVLANGIFAGVLVDVPLRAQLDGSGRVDELSLAGAQGVGLGPRGRALFSSLLLDPAPSKCGALQAAICSDSCAGEVVQAAIEEGGIGQLEDWLGPQVQEVFSSWLAHQADASEPSPAERENPLLAALIEGSPAYRLAGLRSQRFFPLVSLEDDVVIEQGEAAGQRYAAALLATGAELQAAAPFSADRRGTCEHSDYLSPERECGWSLVLDELSLAFSR